MRPARVLPVFAFISGAAALTYESLWMRCFGLIFGVTTHALSVTLVAFMSGLALGSALVARFRIRGVLRAYAVVEAGIGLSALLTLPLLRGLPAWYGSLLQAHPLPEAARTALRFLAAGSVVLLPTLLLGATFPLLVEALSRGSREFRASLGRLYLLNTLGGAAGVFLAGFILLPALGVSRTLLCAALANILVGALAFVAGRAADGAPPGADDRRTGPAEGRGRLPALFAATAVATGACSLGLEVLWTRSLSQVIGSSIYAFNLMLVAFLLGIVLGTAVYERMRTRLDRPAPALAAALAGLALLILIDLVVVGWLPLLFFNLMKVIPISFMAHQAAGFLLCLLAMLPITTLFGFCFPLLIHLVAMGRRTPQQVSGLLYAWNTLGAIGGSIATGYLLIPATGLQASFIWMAALALLAGSLIFAFERPAALGLRAAPAAVLGAAMLLVGALWRPWDLTLMTSGVYKYGLGWIDSAPPDFFWLPKGLAESRRLLFYEEGQEAVAAVARIAGDNSILVNGKADGGTNRWDSATQKLLAHAPLMLHPGPRKVMVIGWGTGGTAGTAALYPITDLRVVEIEPAVFRAASFFAEVNRGVERDPRFRITFDDARAVLLTSNERYDVIISEPSNPWISGVANLFTEEFYRIVLARLEEGGIFCQWFHYYNMTLEDVKTQMRSFAGVFPHAALWVVPPSPPEEGPATVSGDLLFLGSRAPLVLDVARAAGRFREPAIASSLSVIAVRDATDLLLDQVMERDELLAFAGDGPRNTDDRPAIEFSAPRGLFIGTDESARIFSLLEAGGRGIVPALVNHPGLRAASGSKERARVEVALAAGLHRKAMLERATRLLREALTLDPDAAPAHAEMGEILYVQGRRDEAEPLLRRALRLDASLKRPYEILGFLGLDRKDLVSARRDFESLTRRHPDDAIGWYGLALIDVEEKGWARARQRLSKALAIQPVFDQARQLLEFVNRQAP